MDTVVSIAEVKLISEAGLVIHSFILDRSAMAPVLALALAAPHNLRHLFAN